MAFDPTGILKELKKSMPDVVPRVYLGVHCPAGKKKYEIGHNAEIYNDASYVLTKRDLDEISKRLEKFGKR
jgi:hypothetical protein